MTDIIQELRQKIKLARAYFIQTHQRRVKLAGFLSRTIGVNTVEFEFPEPDTAHSFLCMFDRRMGEPTTYRLSFGRQLKWVGVSHPWGLKPADIVVEEATQ